MSDRTRTEAAAHVLGGMEAIAELLDEGRMDSATALARYRVLTESLRTALGLSEPIEA
jgi:hypothetical protein